MSTTQYPGVLRTSWGYLSQSILALVKMSLSMAIICSFLLYGFIASDNQLSIYVLFAFGGLVLYISQLSIDDELTSLDEVSESTAVTHLLTILAVVYYNTVLFLSVFFALSVSLSGYPAVAIIVAGLYPIYDAEMAETGWPISVAGAIVMTVGILGVLIEFVEDKMNLYYHKEFISEMSSLRKWKTAIQDNFTSQINDVLDKNGRSNRPA